MAAVALSEWLIVVVLEQQEQEELIEIPQNLQSRMMVAEMLLAALGREREPLQLELTGSQQKR